MSDAKLRLFKVFTITANNPTEGWETRVASDYDGHKTVHLRGQLERVSTTHVQAWIFFRDPCTTASVITRAATLFGGHPHVEGCRTDRHAHKHFHYVHKDESSLGTRFSVGCNVPKRYLGPYIPEPEPILVPQLPKRVIVFYGVPRSGKTTAARRICQTLSPNGHYEVPIEAKGQASRWIGPYEGQTSVLIDEFNPRLFSRDQLKLLFDSQPSSVSTAMGGRQALWNPDTIIVILNSPSKFDQKVPTTPQEKQEWVVPLLWIKDEVFRTRVSAVFQFFHQLPPSLLSESCIWFE